MGALQANPALTPTQIYQALRSSALPMANPSPNLQSGYGFVQANTQITSFTGGNPALQPEKSDSYTVGLQYHASWAETGITDKLERLIESALRGSHEEVFAAIQERHRRLAAELQIPVSAALERQFQELGQISAGVALVGELSDRTRARVMAAGELMATDLGARFLKSQGLDAHWLDARTVLKADERRGGSAKASVLNATCIFTPDEAFRERP